MKSEQDLMHEYLSIVQQIEKAPQRHLLNRLFEMVEFNFTPAMHTLSVCFERGVGVEQNDQAAFDYCQAAARLKNPAAMHNMGCNYLSGKNVERNSSLALAYFNSAAKAGYLLSAHCVGWLYDNGDDGVESNGELARIAYEWSFRNGYVASGNNLGVYYLCGRHTPPDVAKAEEFLKKAASAGCEEAQANLSRLGNLKNRDGANGLRDIRSYAKLWLEDFPF